VRQGRAQAVAVVLLTIITSGCSPRDVNEHPAPGPDMQVVRARARLTPAQVGAVYLTLVNATAQDDRLLSAESTAAASVELHEVIARGDVLQMRARPEGFAIPAGGRTELGPGGKHLMLYSVRASSADIDLTLHFARSGVVRVRVPVIGADEDVP
jgi:periplasmic copper chaperone A